MALPSWIEQSKRARLTFEAEGHACPTCGEPGLSACGGPGSYWLEHRCGAYSELKPTLDEALKSNWVNVDPKLNACMNPPVGGGK